MGILLTDIEKTTRTTGTINNNAFGKAAGWTDILLQGKQHEQGFARTNTK